MSRPAFRLKLAAALVLVSSRSCARSTMMSTPDPIVTLPAENGLALSVNVPVLKEEKALTVPSPVRFTPGAGRHWIVRPAYCVVLPDVLAGVRVMGVGQPSDAEAKSGTAEFVLTGVGGLARRMSAPATPRP